MTARQRLDEMEQFMKIARGDLPQINEGHIGEVEVGGQFYPWRRIPIEVYDQFKAQYPGSRVRFRGPKRGGANTKKPDATHFYIVRTGPEVKKEADPNDETQYEPPLKGVDWGVEDRPHTPGYNKQGSGGRAAADSRAQAFIFDDVNEDQGGQECMWWAMCTNDATTTEPHPILGAVPICDRCVGKLRKIEGLDEGNDAECTRCCGLGRHPGKAGEDCPECHGTGKCPKVKEDLDPEGQGYYNVTIKVDDNYPDEVETAVDRGYAHHQAEKLVGSLKKGQWEVKKWQMQDATEWQVFDGEVYHVIRVEPTDDADAEAWHGESVELGSIVESVLEEYPGQPKDYYEPEDDLGPMAKGKSAMLKAAGARDLPMSDYEQDNIESEYDDSELGLRFD